MKLASVKIENFRAIGKLTLPLDPRLTVLHGANAHGKTSVLGRDASTTSLPSYLLITTQATPSLSSFSGIGGVLSAT